MAPGDSGGGGTGELPPPPPPPPTPPTGEFGLGLIFTFRPMQTSFRLATPEVRGFEATEPSQAAVDQAADALAELHDRLPPGPQAALSRLVAQASQAAD